MLATIPCPKTVVYCKGAWYVDELRFWLFRVELPVQEFQAWGFRDIGSRD